MNLDKTNSGCQMCDDFEPKLQPVRSQTSAGGNLGFSLAQVIIIGRNLIEVYSCDCEFYCTCMTFQHHFYLNILRKISLEQ